ncbi:MAG: hypothetical protein INQ03_19045 [Candidatus Heimdallarchaeota archaeon]|nr:hypothetical protein [Candidatus Heimdallarchaeota archaeon]
MKKEEYIGDITPDVMESLIILEQNIMIMKLKELLIENKNDTELVEALDDLQRLKEERKVIIDTEEAPIEIEISTYIKDLINQKSGPVPRIVNYKGFRLRQLHYNFNPDCYLIYYNGTWRLICSG